MTDPPLAGRRLRTARPAGADPELDPSASDPPIPSAAKIARLRCPRCGGRVETNPCQDWNPFFLLLLCRDPRCGLISLHDFGLGTNPGGGRRWPLTTELVALDLGAYGLEPQVPPPPSAGAMAAAREILSYSAARPRSGSGGGPPSSAG